jgi:hypothetical protein
MKQFTVIYIYPEDGRVGSIEVQAETQDDSFLVAAKALAYQELDEVDMVVSLLGTTAMNQWMGPAADGWKTCNVEDYLKSMEGE